MTPKCEHEWEPAETPVTERARWFKCNKCGAHGWARVGVGTWKRRMGVVPKVEVRKCGVTGCSIQATAALEKKGYRGETQWRCGGHSKP